MADEASEVRIDDEAVRWAGAGDELLVLLHGIGSNEHDLAGLAPHLPSRFRIASLRATLPYGPGFAWADFSPVETGDHAQLDASAAAVLAWLDAQQASAVHLLGFSQGGALAVQLARLAPERFASIVHLASFVALGELPGDAVLAAREPRMPLFTSIGDLDEVISRERVARATPWLDAHFAVERHVYHRAHSIVGDELADVVAFLERQPHARSL